MNSWLRASVTVLAAVLAVGATSSRAFAQAEPFTIDVVINLTGPNAFIGSVYGTSLRVFEKYVNAHGGITGRPLKFEFHDDQTNPQLAVQIASQIVAKNPAVFFGGTQTAACAAVASLVKNGPVDFCISPGYFPESGGYAFASSASLRYIIAAHMRFAQLKGYRRLAVLNATDATGQSSDRTITQLLTAREFRDVKVVSWQAFNPTDLSVAAQVQRIKEARPDAVMCFAGGTAFGTVLRNLNDAGVELPVITSSANINPRQLEQYKAFIPADLYFNGLIYDARDELPAASRPAVDAFLDAFKTADERVSPGSGIAWDPAWITVAALRKLGTSATSTQLRDYLLGLHGFSGAMGTYDFRIGDQHGLTDTSVVMVRWDANLRTFQVVSRPGGVPLKAPGK